MAASRPPSRGSDGPALRALRRPAALTREMDAGDDAEMVEVPESSDNASPRPVSPLHGATKGFCKLCKGGVGDFFNSWIKVTGSYYLPALLGSYSSVLSAKGRQKPASMGTELDGW